MREFLQDLPNTAAADAWQRGVELTMQTPIDPSTELRVKAGKAHVDLTGAHPFFWAGYLVVDTGWRPAPPKAAAGEPMVVAPSEKPAAGAAAPATAGPAPPGTAPVPAAPTDTNEAPAVTAPSAPSATEPPAAAEPEMKKSDSAPPPAPTPPPVSEP
jgi:hypothetical protein